MFTLSPPTLSNGGTITPAKPKYGIARDTYRLVVTLTDELNASKSYDIYVKMACDVVLSSSSGFAGVNSTLVDL
jgi:hypothetical protein